MNEFNHTIVSASEACGFTKEESKETFNLFGKIIDVLLSESNTSEAVEAIEVFIRDTNTNTRQLLYAVIKANEFMLQMVLESTNSAKVGNVVLKEIVGNG